jgi:hypothetical protein
MPQNPPYLPSLQVPLGDWAQNFEDLITAAPGDYNLVAGDAVIIAAATNAYIAALALAINPATRTPVAVADKDAERANMLAVVRPYAVTIAGDPSVSVALKTGVGVTNRSTLRTRNSVVAIGLALSALRIPTGGIQFRGTDPATPLTKSRPLGALGWELQVRESAAGVAPFTTIFSVVATKPIIQWVPNPLPPGELDARARWVGASLNGGAPNVGPWSAWMPLDGLL